RSRQGGRLAGPSPATEGRRQRAPRRAEERRSAGGSLGLVRFRPAARRRTARASCEAPRRAWRAPRGCAWARPPRRPASAPRACTAPALRRPRSARPCSGRAAEPTALVPYHEPPLLLPAGRPVTLAYALLPGSARGTLFVRNDLQQRYTRLPLSHGTYCPGDAADAAAMRRDKVCGAALLARV